MATEKRQLEVRGISVEVVRKDIKNLHLGVYPPRGRVRVAVPLHLDDEAVRLAVISRLGWIRRRQDGFAQQDRQSQREMVTGESHYVQGRRYRLNIIEQEGSPKVILPNNTILEMRVRPSTDRDQRETILNRWYRRRLREQITELIEKWTLWQHSRVPLCWAAIAYGYIIAEILVQCLNRYSTGMRKSL